MTSADARVCEQLTRSHARTFSVASLLLPSEKRRATYALYAFCRVADDLIDSANTAESSALPARLGDLKSSLDAALKGRGSDPVFRELAWATQRFGIPGAPLYELLEGVSTDLTAHQWASWPDLLRYCEGVAGSVGEMCAAVMGVRGGPGTVAVAIGHARTLGVAMQLTNILRDIGEDAGRRRCYLPLDELAEVGLTANDVLDGSALLQRDRWNALMQSQVARARRYYDVAAPGMAMLEADAQRCASACAVGYARILDAIERNGYDSFTRRAHLGWGERALVLGRVLLHPLPAGASDAQSRKRTTPSAA